MKELRQKQFFIEKHFIIKRDGVENHKRSLETDSSAFITYSDIDDRQKARVIREKYPILFYVGVFIMLVGLLRASLLLDEDISRSLIGGGLTVALGIIILFIYRLLQLRYFLLPLEEDKHLYMIHNAPNPTAFEAFVDAIYEARKLNYRKNYFYINEESDKKTEVSRMKWLLKENIITDEEYEDIVDEINLRFM